MSRRDGGNSPSIRPRRGGGRSLRGISPLYPAALVFYTVIVLIQLAWIMGSLAAGVFGGGFGGMFSPRALGLLGNSLGVAGGAALLAGVIGVPLGVLIARTDLPGRRMLAYLTLIPLLLPLPLRGIAWITICLPEGIVNNTLRSLSGADGPVISAYGMPGCWVVLAFSLFPIVLWTTAAGLLSAPAELEEDARLDAGAGSVMARVSLRAAAESIGAGLALVFAVALADFDTPMLLQVSVYPVEVFTYFNSYNDPAGAVRTCLPLFLVLGGFGAAAVFWGSRFRFDRLASETRPAPVFRPGRWRAPVLSAALIVIMGPLALDLGILFWRAGGLDAYGPAWRAAQEEAVRGLLWSAVSAAFMVLLAAALCGMWRSRRGRLPRWIAPLSMAPLFIPAPVLGLSLIAVWNHRWSAFVYDSPIMFVLAFTLRFLPLAVFIVSTAMAALPREIDEQAAISGAGPASRLTRVLLPAMTPALTVALAVCFIFCFAEVGASQLICPPGQTTLALRLHNFMHYGPDRQVAALTLGVTGLVLLLAIGAIGAIGVRRRMTGDE